MKLVRIIQDCYIPGTPAFKCGQQVRVSDGIADMLVERGHAKHEKGKSEDEVKKEKKEPKKPKDKRVSVERKT